MRWGRPFEFGRGDGNLDRLALSAPVVELVDTRHLECRGKRVLPSGFKSRQGYCNSEFYLTTGEMQGLIVRLLSPWEGRR